MVDQPKTYRQAVVVGNESDLWFELADILGQARKFGLGNVWRIGDDQVDFGDGRGECSQQISLVQLNSINQLVASEIRFGDLQCGAADVGRNDSKMIRRGRNIGSFSGRMGEERKIFCDANSDAAATGTNVDENERGVE